MCKTQGQDHRRRKTEIGKERKRTERGGEVLSICTKPGETLTEYSTTLHCSLIAMEPAESRHKRSVFDA